MYKALQAVDLPSLAKIVGKCSQAHIQIAQAPPNTAEWHLCTDQCSAHGHTQREAAVPLIQRSATDLTAAVCLLAAKTAA